LIRLDGGGFHHWSFRVKPTSLMSIETVDPKVKEFLRYILSREGQQAVAREGGYGFRHWQVAALCG